MMLFLLGQDLLGFEDVRGDRGAHVLPDPLEPVSLDHDLPPQARVLLTPNPQSPRSL